MKALFYSAELRNKEANTDKMQLMSLWADVHEVKVAGIIGELNEEQTLGDKGKAALSKVLEYLDVDAVVVMSASDLGKETPRICEMVQTIHLMGVDVISIQGDLPDCEECKNGPKQVEDHCTVMLFVE